MPRPRIAPEHVRLLHGPYTAAALQRGDRATCLYRDGDVIITGWSDARISWPRCRLTGTHGGGSGLLVDEELARAVRCESALAIRYWWGASHSAVFSWRQALGVEPLNEGSAKLRAELNREKGAKLRGKKLPPEQVERRRQTARQLGLRPPGNRPNGSTPWTEAELALLGTLPDEVLAGRIGRTKEAVRVMRAKQGLRTALDRRRRGAKAKTEIGSQNA